MLDYDSDEDSELPPFLFQSLYVLTDTNISNILIFINYGLTVIINIFSKFNF